MITEEQPLPQPGRKINQLALYFLLLLPIAGEFGRLGFGPGTGALLSDILIPLLGIFWITVSFFTGPHTNTPRITESKLFLPLVLFLIAGALSLVHSLLLLPPMEVISGSTYLIRYFFYALLYFITLQSIRNEKEINWLLGFVTLSATLVAVAGFVQLTIYPDLTALEEIGWDPHINRLVSTWLDPNFVGGLLAFVISLLLGITLHIKNIPLKTILIGLMGFMAIALFLTYSRSSYVALGLGVTIASLLKSRKILIALIILGVVGISVSERAQERVIGLQETAAAIFTETPDTPDPSSQVRIRSYENTFALIEKRPILGVGYNNLRAIQHQEGFVIGEDVHSAGGSDTSLLTILATTGIVGLIPFALLYAAGLHLDYRNWRNQKLTPLLRGLNLGLLAAIPALLLHSIFVNSLLYPHILITFWICLGIADWTRLHYRHSA